MEVVGVGESGSVCRGVKRQSTSRRQVLSSLSPLFAYLGDTIQSRNITVRVTFKASSEGEQGVCRPPSHSEVHAVCAVRDAGVRDPSRGDAAVVYVPWGCGMYRVQCVTMRNNKRREESGYQEKETPQLQEVISASQFRIDFLDKRWYGWDHVELSRVCWSELRCGSCAVLGADSQTSRRIEEKKRR